jgi:hypothetical protein
VAWLQGAAQGRSGALGPRVDARDANSGLGGRPARCLVDPLGFLRASPCICTRSDGYHLATAPLADREVSPQVDAGARATSPRCRGQVTITHSPGWPESCCSVLYTVRLRGGPAPLKVWAGASVHAENNAKQTPEQLATELGRAQQFTRSYPTMWLRIILRSTRNLARIDRVSCVHARRRGC